MTNRGSQFTGTIGPILRIAMQRDIDLPAEATAKIGEIYGFRVSGHAEDGQGLVPRASGRGELRQQARSPYRRLRVNCKWRPPKRLCRDPHRLFRLPAE